MPRVAVIGLDASEWSLLEKYMADGVMPHLAKLRDTGKRVALDARGQTKTARVWESFLAGGADGLGTVGFDSETYQVSQVGCVPVKPFYAHVPGLEVLALDMPFMSLWDDVPGARVCSWGGHDMGFPRASTPRGLLTEIDARFGNNPSFENDHEMGWSNPESLEAVTKAFVVGAERRGDIVAWMMQKFPKWELLLTVMTEGHSAGEFLWHGIDSTNALGNAPTAPLAARCMRDTYAAMDVGLGKIVDALPPGTTTVVIAVHGMQNANQDLFSMVLLPELVFRWATGQKRFHDEDIAAWRAAGMPPVVLPTDTTWDNHIKARFDFPASLRRKPKRSLATRLVAAFRRRILGIKPKPASVKPMSVPIPPELDLPPSEIPVPRSSLDWAAPTWYRDQWPNMRAFMIPSFFDARIRVNLAGREKNGVVSLADYPRVLDELEALLMAARDPRTGAPIVKVVERNKASNPLTIDERDSDLHIMPAGPFDALEHPKYGTIGPFPYRRTGSHSSRGFALVNGPGAEKLPEKGLTYDLAPTLVSLLGRKVPAELTGRSLIA
jgi:hypothetical protein